MRKVEAHSLLAHIRAGHGQDFASLRRLAGPDDFVIILHMQDEDTYHVWSETDYMVWQFVREAELLEAQAC